MVELSQQIGEIFTPIDGKIIVHLSTYFPKSNLGDKQADFREAAWLYQQQGNTTRYQYSNDRIRQLGG